MLGSAGAGILARAGGGRIRLGRAGLSARRQRQRGLDRWSGGASEGRASVADFLSIRGLPVIVNGLVYAISMGGAAGLQRRADRAAACGNVRSPARTRPISPATGCSSVSAEQQIGGGQHQRWPHLLDHRAAALGGRGSTRTRLTWYGPLLVSDRLIVAGISKDALSVSPYTGEILGHGRAVAGGRAGARRWWPAARC